MYEFSAQIELRRCRSSTVPIEVNGYRLNNLLEYTRQVLLILMDEPPQVCRHIIRYYVVGIVIGDAMWEPFRRPFVVHYRKRGYPAPQRIIGTQFVAHDSPRIDLIRYEEYVFGKSAATGLVLVGTMAGSEDDGPIGSGVLDDGTGTDVGIAIEEEEDASCGGLYDPWRCLVWRDV